MPALIKALHDKDDEIREATARALGDIGPNAAAAAPDLLKLLNDKEADVRIGAARGLAGIGKGTKEAAHELVKELGNKDIEVRQRASKSWPTWALTLPRRRRSSSGS